MGRAEIDAYAEVSSQPGQRLPMHPVGKGRQFGSDRTHLLLDQRHQNQDQRHQDQSAEKHDDDDCHCARHLAAREPVDQRHTHVSENRRADERREHGTEQPREPGNDEQCDEVHRVALGVAEHEEGVFSGRIRERCETPTTRQTSVVAAS